ALGGRPRAGVGLAFTADGRGVLLFTARPVKSKGRWEALMQGKLKPPLQRLEEAFEMHALPLDSREQCRAEKFDPGRLAAPVNLYAGEQENIVSTAFTVWTKERMLVPACLALSPNQQTLVLGGVSARGSVQSPLDTQPQAAVLLLDLSAGPEKMFLLPPDLAVSAVAIAPDGKTLAAAGSTGTIQLRD